MSVMSKRDVVEAAKRIAGNIVRTPVLRCPPLDEMAGAELWIKAENLQSIAAFKARGAMNGVAQLSEEERAAGIVTYSSGNHAQAVALAAKRFGIRADIAMPVDAPEIKVASVKALGANVVQIGTTSTERHQKAVDIARLRGATIIEPFDHPHTIAGQGTATLELLEQVAEATSGGTLDALVVPVGGGGLIAGACLASEGTDIAIYGVEPIGCDSMRRSLEAGELVAIEPGPTIADGLRPTQVGALNLEICKARVRSVFTVSDEELGRALVRLLIRAKVLVEPSGAAALAITLRRELPGSPERIGVILSGGNIAPAQLAQLITDYAE